MPKKKISDAKLSALIRDLEEELGSYLSNYAIIETIMLKVFKKHFEIVEIDADEIGDDFQI